MKQFLSSAPVLAALFMGVTAAMLIVANLMYPDLLFHPM
ncbi:MAG: Photosystem I reaction center subunit IX [Cyanobacteria bacterium P01_F01_bin.42]